MTLKRLAINDYNPPKKYNPKQTRIKVWTLILVLTIVGILFSTQSNKLPGYSQTLSLAAPKTNSTLEAIVNDHFSNEETKYAIAIKNLRTNETFFKNEHQSFASASLYKLWIMAATYDQISQGNLNEDQTLSDTIDNLNQEFNISPEAAELTEGSIDLTVKSALNQMITISHNYAALLLTKTIHLSSVNEFLKKNQFNESSIGTDNEDPTTTASDILKFYEMLYQGKLADGEKTNQMLDLLKNQTLNNKIPKYLPKEIPVAHKTGELGYLSHDAGIVYSPQGEYIIVILTESDRPDLTNDKISEISRSIYNYFQQTTY